MKMEQSKCVSIFKAVFVGLILLCATIFNTSCDGSFSTTPEVEVLGFQFERDPFGTRMLVGKARNNTSRTLKYAVITFNLYDSSGAQVGYTTANINNLGSGVVWKFKALIIENGVVSAKITDIMTF
jgi:hypothetical protein